VPPARPRSLAHAKKPNDLPEAIRSFLDKQIELAFVKQPLQDVLEYIKEAGGGDIDLVLQNPDGWAAAKANQSDERLLVTASIKHVSVAAALQALADLNGGAFIVRDYGILVISPREAAELVESYRDSGARIIAPPEQKRRRGTAP
jgi:hypothetical protein